MEKLVAPRKAITAHTRVVAADDALFRRWRPTPQRAWIDRHVPRALAGEGLTTAGFTPLQVLGVPGWWPQGRTKTFMPTPRVPARSGRIAGT